ncbi:MAG: undecaprenyl-diphosphate phosphatase [Gammaproteobacteria bacterium]
MDWLQVIVLSLLQGLLEFLPISSSAHLILPAELTDWPDQGLAFDVAVHVGTLAAVVAYFRRELIDYARGSMNALVQRRLNEDAEQVFLLALATVPIVIAGVLLKDWVESALRSVPIIAAASILFGLLLWYADRRHGTRSVVTWRDAAIIGAMQVLSIVPGTSRSGITLTAALLLGMTRAAGARFSFLLSIPTIAGAGLLLANDALAEGHAAQLQHLLVGAALAGVAAYTCIRLFIALIDRTGMLPYVIYRIVLGIVLLALWGGLFG